MTALSKTPLQELTMRYSYIGKDPMGKRGNEKKIYAENSRVDWSIILILVIT
jgi:hypothetical protein